MTTPAGGTDRHNPAGVKTLAIRLEPDVHTQLTLIAQLRGSTITVPCCATSSAYVSPAIPPPRQR